VCLSCNQKASLRACRLPQLQSEGVASSVAFASATIRRRRFERGVCLSYNQKASLRAWRLPQLQSEGVASSVAFAFAAAGRTRLEECHHLPTFQWLLAACVERHSSMRAVA